MRRTLILCACLALTGCGGGDSDGGKAAPAVSGDTVTIEMKNTRFVPRNATVKVGQTVRWVNRDTIVHDAAADEGADFKSELFGKGQSFDWKADRAGTVEYECTIHPGMTGTLNVTG